MTARRRLRVCVHGVVQGVGFRPFVYTTAAALGLSGSVRNDTSGAIVEVEGDPAEIEHFLARLRDRPPPLAVIESIETHDVPPVGGTGFAIADTSRSDGGRTLASPDVAMCADCAAEQRDPANRRYRHAFVNCTNCGPRFTIIAALPYDRASTTMASFAMCAECAREYTDPADRRFHAQPVCCPNCGPVLRYRDGDGGLIDGDDALPRARQLLRDGGILAVKGLGGYHLACDANDERAVAELRRRKRRGDKPFAVMVPDLPTACAIADVDGPSARLLAGPQRPIVLVPRRRDARIADAVAPHNPDLGVMLAYTPLHTLLFGLVRRCRRAARAGDDVRQSRRRADLLHRRRCARTAFAPRRRLADARSGHPGAVRRLRRPVVAVAVPTGSTMSSCRSGARAVMRRCPSRCRCRCRRPWRSGPT